jgi:hypothetical protein
MCDRILTQPVQLFLNYIQALRALFTFQTFQNPLDYRRVAPQRRVIAEFSASDWRRYIFPVNRTQANLAFAKVTRTIQWAPVISPLVLTDTFGLSHQFPSAPVLIDAACGPM